MGFIERLSLPLLALIWIGAIAIMAWIVYRRAPSSDQSDGAAEKTTTSAPPSGPLTAVQRTALSRRRRLAK